MRISVLIADRHSEFQVSLGQMLAGRKDISVVGSAGDARSTSWLLESLSPDIVVIDPDMPDLCGKKLIEAILAENPGVKVIALSLHADRRIAQGLLGAGALGYVLKECVQTELLEAIYDVFKERQYISKRVSRGAPSRPQEPVPLP